MNPITRMMKRYIKTPLKYALPLLFIGSLVLASTTGCVTNNSTKNESGWGSGDSGVDVIVNSKQVSDQLGTGYLAETPKAGYHYLFFNVTVKNLKENDWTIGNSYNFKLTTSDGSVYQPSSSSSLGNYALESVSHTSPGEKVTGQIAFEVPENAQPTKLQYSDSANSVVVNIGPISSTPSPPQVTSLQKTVGNKTTFSSSGFSITYPKTLKSDSSTKASNPVRIFIYLASNNTMASVSVANSDITTSATLSDFVDYNMKAINEYPNYQQISTKRTTIGGKPANIIIWQATVPVQVGDTAIQQMTLKVMQTFVINNNKGYVVTYKAPQGDYDTYLAQAQQIISSFSLT